MVFLDVFFWTIWITGVLLVLAYGAALLFGAPYIPTLKKQQAQALDLLDLKKGQIFVDLGCGDGHILKLAAQRGLKAVGYEINPFLALYAWLRTRRHGRKVKVVWGSFWRANLKDVDGIFVFLIGHHMKRLDELISSQSHKGLKVVSHGFKIPGQKVKKKQGALFLYHYS